MCSRSAPAPLPIVIPNDLTTAQLTDMRRRSYRMKYDLWDTYSLRCIRWEAWAISTWNVLHDTVQATQSSSMYLNLKHSRASRVATVLQDDFCTVTMIKNQRGVEATTIFQFAALADDKFECTNGYMQAFADTMRAYLYSSLMQVVAISCMSVAEDELRSKKIAGRLLMVPRGTQSVLFPANIDLVNEMSRLKGVVTCLRVLKAAAAVDPSPYSKANTEDMMLLRIAAAVMQILLTENQLSGRKASATMYFLSYAVADSSTATVTIPKRLLHLIDQLL